MHKLSRARAPAVHPTAPLPAQVPGRKKDSIWQLLPPLAPQQRGYRDVRFFWTRRRQAVSATHLPPCTPGCRQRY